MTSIANKNTRHRFDCITEADSLAYVRTFTQANLTDTGLLTIEEFKEALRIQFGKALPIEQVIVAFQKFDRSGDGFIDMQEYMLASHYISNIRAFRSEKKKLLGNSFLLQAAQMAVDDDKKLLYRLSKTLYPFRHLLCVQEGGELADIEAPRRKSPAVDLIDPEFKSPYSPTQMRCLALVSHDGMKSTMKEFVMQHANLLKKFRLTGTASTMKMLDQVFGNDPKVVYGPTCKSGPLGGDAQLVAQMCSENLGGIIFFQDPMESHIHDVDIACLNRQALIYNIPTAGNPTSALMMVNQMRHALMGNLPSLLPSFFLTLQCPSVEAYKKRQAGVVAYHEDSESSKEFQY